MCVANYCVADPQLVLLIIPIFLILVFLINRTFVSFKDKEEAEEFHKQKARQRSLILISRTLITLLLLIALTSIYTEKSVTVPGDTSLTILADNSTSFDMFDQTVAQELASNLKGKVPLELKYIAAGESSAIGDGILNNMKGDDNIMVITDGNNNKGRVLGDVMLFASSLNTSISTLDLEPIKNDIGIKITGPSQAIIGEENTFTVDLNKIGAVSPYLLQVYVDKERIFSEKNGNTYEFTKKFSEGYHKIEAVLTANDYFKQNNIYYKTIKIIQKPKVLFISEKTSPLLVGLDHLYEVMLSETLHNDLSSYHAVILNDISGNKIAGWVKRLTDYVADGNGLVVIGGEYSYDRGFYQNPSFLIENLLPVRVGIPEMSEENKANIIILIDTSASTAIPFKGSATYIFDTISQKYDNYFSGPTVLDVEKAIALNLIDTLRPDDRVGVIALRQKGYTVSNLVSLDEEKKEELITKIQQLKAPPITPDTRIKAGTLFEPSLRNADFFLSNVEGTKSIIFISDGYEPINTQIPTLSFIEKRLAQNAIRLNTVGVGLAVNEEHLKKMAELGHGIYFEVDETKKLNLLFTRRDPETQKEEKEDEYALFLIDKNHWITKEDINLDAALTGYNYVVPKLGARTIAATSNMRPVITVGNFGLGRVAAISTDDGGKWAADLLKKQNSKLITRTINYAIGDPGRNLDFDVSVDDTPINKPSEIKVISKNVLKSEIPLSKIRENLYSGTFTPEQTGFTTVLGADVAVNYNDEYLDLGLNPELEELVTLTRGKVFDKGDIEGIAETIKTVSRRVKIDTVNYRWPFALAALLLLLTEIIIRRIKENLAR